MKSINTKVLALFIALTLNTQTVFSSCSQQAQANLIESLRHNNLSQSIESLKAGADLFAMNQEGITPLHEYLFMHSTEKDTVETISMIDKLTDCAAEHYKIKMRETIIDRVKNLLPGKKEALIKPEIFSLDAEDAYGQTLLYVALILGYKRIPDLLQEKGAHINYKNHEGNTLLHLIALNKQLHEAYKALPSPTTHLKTAAVIAHNPASKRNFIIPKKPIKPVIEQSEEETALLKALSMGADINARNAEQKTPIMSAVIAKNYPIINQLLWHVPERKDAQPSLNLLARDLKLRDTFNKTALDYAKEIEGFDGRTLELLKAGASE